MQRACKKLESCSLTLAMTRTRGGATIVPPTPATTTQPSRRSSSSAKKTVRFQEPIEKASTEPAAVEEEPPAPAIVAHDRAADEPTPAPADDENGTPKHIEETPAAPLEVPETPPRQPSPASSTAPDTALAPPALANAQALGNGKGSAFLAASAVHIAPASPVDLTQVHQKLDAVLTQLASFQSHVIGQLSSLNAQTSQCSGRIAALESHLLAMSRGGGGSGGSGGSFRVCL